MKPIWVIVVVLGMIGSVVSAADPNPVRGSLYEEIDQSLRRGVAFLKKSQRPDGSWGQGDYHWREGTDKTNKLSHDPDGGRTALIVMALLSAGETPGSPEIVKALSYLQARRPKSTYAVGLRACVYSMLGKSKVEALRTDLRQLVDMMFVKEEFDGLYTYGNPNEKDSVWAFRHPDLSNSQYAVLGVWFASNSGIPVARDYWRRVETSWQNFQLPDGGWPYMKGEPARASMTAAALTVLHITQDHLRAGELLHLDKTFDNPHIESGLKWLADNFTVTNDGPLVPAAEARKWGRWTPSNYSTAKWPMYCLYGYERVGEASGLTRFGEHVWFDEGARFLIETQQPDGSWKGGFEAPEDTAFGVLFLSRGRDPVAIQKLKFPGRWNNRPRDTYRMIHFLREQTERHVNWQIVDVDQPINELVESPVLYVASNEALQLNDEQKKRLKEYLTEGGLIVCAQEGNDSAFSNSVIALAKEWFPNYQFQPLPPEHPVLKGTSIVKDLRASAQGLSNGIRELILLFPDGDLPARWHSPAAAARVSKESPYLVIGNIVSYATGRTNPKFKGEREVIRKNPAIEPSRRINVARLKFGEAWDPEPTAWDRLSAILWNKDKVDVRLTPIVLGKDEMPPRTRLIHWTVTDKTEFTYEQDKALRDFVKGGGLVVIDIAGGNRQLMEPTERLLRRAFIAEPLKPIPTSEPPFAGEGFKGDKIESVIYRRWLDEQLGRSKVPRLKGIYYEGRLAIIYSSEDLTYGLTGGQTDAILGYSPESSVELMRNMILYAASRPAPAQTTAPAAP